MLIEGAVSCIDIQTPYFLPDRALRRALVRAARGEEPSQKRPFLSLSDEERSEVAQRKLRERIAYHEAKLAEDRAASAGE